MSLNSNRTTYWLRRSFLLVPALLLIYAFWNLKHAAAFTTVYRVLIIIVLVCLALQLSGNTFLTIASRFALGFCLFGTLISLADDRIDRFYPRAKMKRGLHEAVKNNRLDLLRAYLARGANIDAVYKGKWNCGESELNTAGRYASTSLGCTADPHRGKTLLIFAAQYNRPEISRWLIQHGINIQGTDKKGRNALYYFLLNHDKEGARLVIAKGLRKKNDLNLNFFLRRKNRKAARYLIENEMGLNTKYKTSTPVVLAAKYNYADLLGLLLSRGADASAQEGGILEFRRLYGRNNSALMYAVKNGAVRSVVSLLDKGANPDLKDRHGRTALMLAIQRGNGRMIELIAARADPDIEDEKGRTALMYATRKSDLVTMKTLVGKKADVNIQDNRGYTALMYNIESRPNTRVVEHLVTNGARVDLEGNDGNTALILAVKKRTPRGIIRLLKTRR